MNSATWVVAARGDRRVAKAVPPASRAEFAAGLTLAGHVQAAGVCGLVNWAAAISGPLLYDLASAAMYVGGPGAAAPAENEKGLEDARAWLAETPG